MTTKSYIYGTFSNSATKDSPLKVSIAKDYRKLFTIQLYEYAGTNPVHAYSEAEYWVHVKADDGSKFKVSATHYSDWLNIMGTEADQLHAAFVKYKTLRFYIWERGSHGSSKYSFAVDATGYSKTYGNL